MRKNISCGRSTCLPSVRRGAVVRLRPAAAIGGGRRWEAGALGGSSEMSQKRQPEEGERPRWGGGGGGQAESGGSSAAPHRPGEPKRQRVPALREYAPSSLAPLPH
jgi:hypothetical protein